MSFSDGDWRGCMHGTAAPLSPGRAMGYCHAMMPKQAEVIPAPRDSACCPGATSDVDANGDLALLCKALAHPARVALLRHLMGAEGCVFGTLAGVVSLAPSTVAQHLAHLRAAGLVRQWDDGANSCYCVSPERLAALKALVAGL